MIYLLINGIASRSLRGTLVLKIDSICQFLEEMHRITSMTSDPERRSENRLKFAEKAKDLQCKQCGRKEHTQKQYRISKLTCFLCKAKGHVKSDCPKRKRDQLHLSNRLPLYRRSRRSHFRLRGLREFKIRKTAC